MKKLLLIASLLAVGAAGIFFATSKEPTQMERKVKNSIESGKQVLKTGIKKGKTAVKNGLDKTKKGIDEFRTKENWLCTCSLYSDADGSLYGNWTGDVVGRTQTGTSKIGANRVCEKATKNLKVDCKSCSCRKDDGSGQRGIKRSE